MLSFWGFLFFVVPNLFLSPFCYSNQYLLSVHYEQSVRFQEEDHDGFGACIFFTVAEPTGLNPLEIAGNFVIKCHLSFSKLKEVVQKGGPETKRGGPEIPSIT